MPLLNIAANGASQSEEWFQWHLHPEVVLVLLALMGAYVYTISVLRQRIPDAGRVKGEQTLFFSLGMLVLYIAGGSPVHDISENYLLSVHMVQHLLFTLVAPPLLLAGMPSWFWEAVFRRPGALAAGRIIFHPLVAIGAFNFVIVVTHLPGVVDLSLREHSFHFLVHAVLVATALMMWWPVLSNFQKLPRLSYPYQMAYLFVQSLVPAVIAGFLTFSTGAVYEFYKEAPRIWGMNAVEDQQIAAAVMKILGSLILWSFIAVAFFKWFAKEEAAAREPHWDRVEEELREMGLNPRQ